MPTSSIPNRGLGFARLIAGCWFCPTEGTPNCRSGVSKLGGEGEGRIAENSVCVRARYSETLTSRSASNVSSETYKKASENRFEGNSTIGHEPETSTYQLVRWRYQTTIVHKDLISFEETLCHWGSAARYCLSIG